MLNTLNKKYLLGIWAGISLLLFYALQYEIQRSETSLLFGVLALLFIGYFLVIHQHWQDSEIGFLIFVGLLFRVLLMFKLPNLSDDFYRFIWDGELLSNGINPFDHIPTDWLKDHYTEHLARLYKEMNSPDYYSVYPPVCQYLFASIAALFSGNIFEQVLIYKVILLLVEIASIFGILLLLEKLYLPKSYVIWYVLNPLVIIEFCGNMHLEAIMICALIWSFYFLLLKNWWIAGLFFAIGISVKLLPLMLLPLFFRKLEGRSLLIFYGSILLFTFLFFLPIMNLDQIQNLLLSVQLYFKTFEFNGSIYYLVRWVGFQVKGYNVIQTAGPMLGIVPLLTIGYLSIFRINRKCSWIDLFHYMQYAFLFYFGVASIVHPWYIAIFVGLGVFTRSYWTIIWSVLIYLSYHVYRDQTYNELLWLTAIEYCVLFGSIVFIEYRRRLKGL